MKLEYELAGGEKLELKDSKQETKFKYSRLGDNVMCPFQYNFYHFKNMKGTDPRKDHFKISDCFLEFIRLYLTHYG
jgi:hypothetical protein